MDGILALSLLSSFAAIMAGACALNFGPRDRFFRFLSGWLMGSGALMFGLTLLIIREATK